jgi:hypothetical protein
MLREYAVCMYICISYMCVRAWCEIEKMMQYLKHICHGCTTSVVCVYV